MPTPFELESERLRLRQWRAGDRAAFAAMSADPEVMEFFPATLSRAESDAYTERCQALIEAQGWGFWAVECKADLAFAGVVGLQALDESFAFAPGVEIGQRLARPYWGRGLCTEAARAALDFGFDHLQLGDIVAFTAELNRRSSAVMERLGMRHLDDFGHQQLAPEHALFRHRLYRITAEEFQSA